MERTDEQRFTLELGEEELTDLRMIAIHEGVTYYLSNDQRIIVVDEDPEHDHHEAIGPTDRAVAALPFEVLSALVLDVFPHLPPACLRAAPSS